MGAADIIRGIACILFYFVCFFAAGLALPQKVHKNNMTGILLLGFMVYFSLFQLIALPMKILELPLKMLSLSWFFLLAVLFVYVFIIRRKNWMKVLADFFRFVKSDKIGKIVFVFALGLGIFLALNVEHISAYDAGYYIGLPVSSVYSNTIEKMDPYTGQMLQVPHHFYLLNTYTCHSAVVYQVLGVHPLIEAKFSITFVLAFLLAAGIYKAGLYLFENNKMKALLFDVFSVLILLYSYSLAGVSHYFAYRTYEGKAVTSYFFVAIIILFFLAVFREKDRLWGWYGMFFAGLSGAAFCNTAIYLIPVLVGTLMLPYFIYTRKKENLISLIVVLCPCVFWLALHIIM